MSMTAPRGRARHRRVPAPAALFVRVGGEYFRVHDLEREPGDEARRIVVLRGEDGVEVACADCGDWHECTCGDHRNGFDCAHIRTLLAEGIFDPVATLSTFASEKGGEA